MRRDVDLQALVAAGDEIVEDRARRMPMDLRGDVGGRREDAAVERHHLVEGQETAALAAAHDHEEILHHGAPGARLSHASPGVVGRDGGHQEAEDNQGGGDTQLAAATRIDHRQQSTLFR